MRFDVEIPDGCEVTLGLNGGMVSVVFKGNGESSPVLHHPLPNEGASELGLNVRITKPIPVDQRCNNCGWQGSEEQLALTRVSANSWRGSCPKCDAYIKWVSHRSVTLRDVHRVCRHEWEPTGGTGPEPSLRCWRCGAVS